MDIREKTKFTGVYRLKSNVRRHDGKPDICFYIYYKDREGKLHKEKVGWVSEGYTAVLASEKRTKRIQEMRDGKDTKNLGHDLTYGAAWEIFKKRHLPNLSRPEEEENRYRFYIENTFSEKLLCKVTVGDIEDFRNSLKEKGLAVATISHILGDIRKVYNKMDTWEHYKGPMPASKLSLPKPDNERKRYLTPEEATKLMDALKPRSLPWWRIAMVSLHAGLRLGEVLALRRRDIDFNARVIHILDAKNGTRMAHMTKTLSSMLKECLPPDPSDLFFASSSGQVMRASDTSKTFARVVSELKLNEGVADRRQKVVFHTLRHTFCSWMAIRGVPLYTIGELAGHSDVEMTKRYSHLCPDVKKSAVDEVDAMAKSSTENKRATRRRPNRSPSPALHPSIVGQPSENIKPGRRPLHMKVRRLGSA